jgi:hypothetical protein
MDRETRDLGIYMLRLITHDQPSYFKFLSANAYATAGTSSSSLRIGGWGPMGVMLKGLICET